MKPVAASAILVAVLALFVGGGMAIGTTSFATGPVADGYGVALEEVATSGIAARD